MEKCKILVRKNGKKPRFYLYFLKVSTRKRLASFLHF